jgi:hypothetical protein
MSVQFEIEKFESEFMHNHIGNYWMRVSDQISLVNRLTFLEWASARVLAGWVPAASELEWKFEMTYFMWQNMSFAERLRNRKDELSGNSKILIPSPKLQEFIQSTSRAEGFMPFLAGWFMEVTKDSIQAIERYLEALDPIFDAPTIELLNDFLPKKRAHVNWAKDLLHEAVKDKDILLSVEKWRKYVRRYMQKLGVLTSGRNPPVSYLSA